MNDLKTFGLYFESMAVRDLRIYADSLGGDLYHFRDSSGLECDAVLHLRNGEYALIEIKLGGKENIDKGVGQYAYRRPDGVFVVPIGSLKN